MHCYERHLVQATEMVCIIVEWDLKVRLSHYCGAAKQHDQLDQEDQEESSSEEVLHKKVGIEIFPERKTNGKLHFVLYFCRVQWRRAVI